MPRLSMNDAAARIARLEPFHTSGSFRGTWERLSGSGTARAYRVKSYGQTIAEVLPMGEVCAVEIQLHYAANAAQAKHIRLTAEALEGIPRSKN